jgi:predicted nuclease with TOPRIM domain
MTNAELSLVESLMTITLKPEFQKLRERIKQLEKENQELKDTNQKLLDKILKG